MTEAVETEQGSVLVVVITNMGVLTGGDATVQTCEDTVPGGDGVPVI